ncbi:alpha/beta hydrolase [Pseudoalteromonas piscicida]|uniref:Alpha/beta hydrolase n=1 Tax=Pseudoalteromonas piscicida TaxID=43662 RepID=A0AAD0RN16_PSEO7|nr:alpha/beta hydrolase [Pseudoalteromonas piscicida]ASD69739.1 hypothetical protein B1L02_23135 [Pseudoalteromonas piscicida]AXR00356.1 alpha/beta hydrolase [Pseudoalteromonas piscicida]AXR04765.1 alpha/beta hydrolase [Pseudoalteromonas piscicida]
MSTFTKLFSGLQRSVYSEIIFRVARRLLRSSEDHSIAWLRRRTNFLSKFFYSDTATYSQPQIIADRQAILITPIENQHPTQQIVFFHGGGFVLDGGHFYQKFCRTLAEQSRMSVLLLNYRLAPEYTYPTAHQDCLLMTQAYLTSKTSHQFHFIGDSAGAALLLTTFQQLASQGKHKNVASLLLLSPWIAAHTHIKSKQNETHRDCISHQNLRRWFNSYYQHSYDTHLASQVYDFPFHALPAVFIQFASDEILAQQIRDFIDHSREKHVALITDEVNHLFHSFQILGLYTQEGKQAMRKIVKFIHNANAVVVTN